MCLNIFDYLCSVGFFKKNTAMKRMIRIFVLVVATVAISLSLFSCDKLVQEQGLKGSCGMGDTKVEYTINKTTFVTGQDLIIELTSSGNPNFIIVLDDNQEATTSTYPYTFKKKMTEKGTHKLNLGLAPVDISGGTTSIRIEQSTSITLTVR